MKTERPSDDADRAHDQRVRSALAVTPADQVQARWNDIEARARGGADIGGVPAPEDRAPAPAANDARLWKRFGVAAVLVLGVGLAMMLVPPGRDAEPALRGVAGAGASEARWLVDHPARAAEALANELRALGAEVQVTPDGAGAVLEVRAAAQAAGAVNARLAPLETGLDGQGRLRLSVVPSR